jgi:hypothetical protein
VGAQDDADVLLDDRNSLTGQGYPVTRRTPNTIFNQHALVRLEFSGKTPPVLFDPSYGSVYSGPENTWLAQIDLNSISFYGLQNTRSSLVLRRNPLTPAVGPFIYQRYAKMKPGIKFVSFSN